MSRKRINQAGDTIVEVLIAIAVVTLTLGGAFTVVNRTFKNARQAQEHAEALKLLEGQLERLKAAAKDPASAAFTTPDAFCFSSTGTFTPMPGVSSLPAGSYPAACNAGTVPGQYHLGIVRGANNVFTAKANWEGPTSGQDEVSLIYRLYP